MCIHQITFANGWFCLNRVKPIYFLAQASEIIPILKQVYSVRLLMEQNLTLLSSLVEIVKDISSEVDNEAYHFTAQKKTGQKKKNDMNQYYISTIKVVFLSFYTTIITIALVIFTVSINILFLFPSI